MRLRRLHADDKVIKAAVRKQRTGFFCDTDASLSTPGACGLGADLHALSPDDNVGRLGRLVMMHERH